jgi:hypothetical protein
MKGSGLACVEASIGVKIPLRSERLSERLYLREERESQHPQPEHQPSEQVGPIISILSIQCAVLPNVLWNKTKMKDVELRSVCTI